jgi:hypothetical protein
MKRVCVNLTPEAAAALKARALETGVPQAEQIRRAINLALFADNQSAREATRQPVLFAQKVDTR